MSYLCSRNEAFDVAIPVGLSYEYKNLVFDVRYSLGLVNVEDVGVIDIDESAHNMSLCLTLGYKIHL